MSGKAREKVATSGRLTGKVGVSRRPLDPEPPPWPQPDYSLYSTDSEDKVSSLHRGLDQCAALLSGILQADEAGLQRTLKREATKPRSSTFLGKKTLKKLPPKTASPGLSRPPKGGAAKSRASTSQGKTVSRKPPSKTAGLQRSDQHQPGNAAAAHTYSPPAAHTGVKLHPPRKPTLPFQSPSASHQTSQHLSTSVPPPKRSNPVLLPNENQSHSGSEAPPSGCRAASDEKEELVPVRDTDRVQSFTPKESHVQLEPGQEPCSKGGTKAETIQNLLEELRALIAGQGSVAAKLLVRLERTVGVSDLKAAGVNQDSHLCQCMKNQHEKVEVPKRWEILLGSREPNLQKELVIAQSRLQELQDDLKELRKALQDTQSQLRATEAEKALIKTDLETARSRLLESEREKSTLASVAQEQLKEIQHLSRLLQRPFSSDHQDIQNSSPLTEQYICQQDPAVASTERIKEYLKSLNQVENTQTENLRVTAEQDKNTSDLKGDRLSDDPIRTESNRPAETVARHQDCTPSRSHSVDVLPRGRQLFDSMSHFDVESVWSNSTIRSESTFNTRDEAAFRDGLAALDASIASLQKTIQLDLRK